MPRALPVVLHEEDEHDEGDEQVGEWERWCECKGMMLVSSFLVVIRKPRRPIKADFDEAFIAVRVPTRAIYSVDEICLDATVIPAGSDAKALEATGYGLMLRLPMDTLFVQRHETFVHMQGIALTYATQLDARACNVHLD